jgi:DNA-directed RNA polymerase subunit RPC12/RpoP
MVVETCPACGFKIEDNHELWEYHVMNTHPSTKACTKCSGTTYYRHHRETSIQRSTFDIGSGWDFFSYICADCGFVLETWKTVESFIDKTENIYMPEKHRSNSPFKTGTK